LYQAAENRVPFAGFTPNSVFKNKKRMNSTLDSVLIPPFFVLSVSTCNNVYLRRYLSHMPRLNGQNIFVPLMMERMEEKTGLS